MATDPAIPANGTIVTCQLLLVALRYSGFRCRVARGGGDVGAGVRSVIADQGTRTGCRSARSGGCPAIDPNLIVSAHYNRNWLRPLNDLVVYSAEESIAGNRERREPGSVRHRRRTRRGMHLPQWQFEQLLLHLLPVLIERQLRHAKT
jgi:hypothetical protein